MTTLARHRMGRDIQHLLFRVYLPLVVVYVLLVMLYPIDPATMARRHLDMAQARLVALAVTIPLLVVWWFALYGARRLASYSATIRQSSDGPAFMKLARGMQIIAWYLPIRFIAKLGLNYLAHLHPAFQTTANVIVTYLGVLLLLMAFIKIHMAARELSILAKVKGSLKITYVLILAFIGLGVSYCYMNFAIKDSIAPTNWLVTSQTAIPLVIRIVTVIIPYLFIWCIGLSSVYWIYLYQKQVKGVFYRQLLRLLANGLMTVITASIVIQFLTNVAAYAQRLTLGLVLAIAYALLLALAGAFVMIIKGVKRLEKLDEV